MKSKYDLLVIGAGIAGLAHAYIAAIKGMSVLVVERDAKASGASIRNFGMIWPIGQATETREMAFRSRELWVQMLERFGIWHEPCGSLHLAHADDEFQVLREYEALSSQDAHSVEILDARQVLARFPLVNSNGLRGGLFSQSEVCVSPFEVIRTLPQALAKTFNVDFVFGKAVTQIDHQTAQLGGEAINFVEAIVCTGSETKSLFPDAFTSADLSESLVPCKLQMMRSEPSPRIGTMLAGGLTLQHYANFQVCPTLSEVKRRFQNELPEYGEFGIHVLVSQHEDGSWTIGDSHEYGDDIEPFDNEEVNQMILDYLGKLVDSIPPIVQRWNGTYLKRKDKAFMVRKVQPAVTVVNGLGGAGMTLSFGLAERVLSGEISHA